MKTKFYSLAILAVLSAQFVLAATDTIKVGSYIVNMGVVPQTIGNGLKPYGLVYDLLKNYHVPIQWVINVQKQKDGIDLIHNGITYRGGVFIIKADYRTAVVNNVIANWEAQGVIGNTTVSEFVTDVTKRLNFSPNWTMDKTNGHLAVSYFTNAGIPSSAYGGDSSNWKHPSQLGACDDIFVLPHADPVWADHSNLYYWNLNHKGNIWAACHAVSAMENLESPDGSIQMNFLSTKGLVPTFMHKKHSTPPFVYTNAGDFVMQFMGTLDGATANGSERSFLPVKVGAWRPTTRVSVSDTIDTYIPGLSAGPAGILAYGKAYGDSGRGWVMYEAGHNHEETGSVSEKVAAQRAFFNYSFFVASERFAEFSASIDGLTPIITTNVPINLSFTVPAWVDLSKYTIQWISSLGGTFTPENSAKVTFTTPVQSGQTVITVSVKDACDRAVFSQQITGITGLMSSDLLLKGEYSEKKRHTVLNWKNLNSRIRYFHVERRGLNGTFVKVGQVISNNPTGLYFLEDKDPPEGLSYYRLAIVDLVGNIRYSNTISIMNSSQQVSGLLSVVNPAKDKIAFKYTADSRELISIVVFDSHGKQLVQNTEFVRPGVNMFEIPFGGQLSAGTYILCVTASRTRASRKINFTP